MINLAPIPSELSLNAGGSRSTEDLPRNLLNSFTNRSKVLQQKREIHAFKEGNWPEDHGQLTRSWGRNQGVVGAVCTERHCGFKFGMNRLEFCFK